MSTMLRRGACALMLVFALLALPFVLGNLAEDPGGWAAVGISVLALVPLGALSVQAARRPGTALRTLALCVGLLAVYAVVEAFLPQQGVGPVVAVGTIVLAVPLAVLGLKHARVAGALMVIDGLLPFIGLVAAAVRNADENGGFHLDGSSGAAGMPVLTVGLLLLLAWGLGLRHVAHPRPGATTRPRHAAP
jgi:hypothetical protein